MESSKRHLENLIDGYFAGQLSFEQTEELFTLLKEDIDTVDQLLTGEMPTLIASSESFPHKNRLRKRYSDLSPDQFEYLCVAAMEGDLSSEQEEEFNSIILTEPARSDIYNSYNRVRFEPGTVIYKSKKSLKKETAVGRIIKMATITLSAAASLALLITAITQFNNTSESGITTTITANSEENIDVVHSIGDTREVVKEKPANKDQTSFAMASEVTPPMFANTDPLSAESAQLLMVRSEMPAPVSGSGARVILASAAPSGQLAHVLYDEIIPYHGPISLKEHLAMNFREKILGEEIPDISPIKAYEIASAGISGINKLLGWEMDLEVKKANSGDVNALAFNSRLINFETPVKKAENEQ